VNSFNDGYRGYRRTYRTCTQSATLATQRFSTEGAQIAASLAQTSVFASGPQAQIQEAPSPAGAAPDETGTTPALPGDPEPPD
jgi:hypothetical protein